MIASWQYLTTVFARFDGVHTPACHHTEGDLTYHQLYQGALALAARLQAHHEASGYRQRAPVLLYGHKHPTCLIAWWACLLTGHPVAPVETDNSDERLRFIADSIQAGLLLNATGQAAPDIDIPALTVSTALGDMLAPRLTDHCHQMGLAFGRGTISGMAYIMFSSGTTGAPKGIRVSYANLAHFVRWAADAFPAPGPISGNIRYCFDVSQYELWLAWHYRQPLSVLDYRDIINTRKMIARHADAGVQTWVSTPALTRNYLRDRTFRQDNLPRLNTFIFCGEVLTKEIVSALWQAFPGCRIVNTYGPTECTVAVTACDIIPAMLDDDAPLPLGYVRPGVELRINAPANSERGEIVIAGPAVGEGYLNAPPVQQARFVIEPDGTRSYRTGDIGSLQNNLLYFHGREDSELKIQGYRIVLSDIENALREHPQVQDAIVTPWLLHGTPQGLQAFILSGQTDIFPALTAYLRRYFPLYMVPKFWYPVDDATLNHNSKLDRQHVTRQALDKGKRYVFVSS
ncbi:AMP-binding protein [Dickeya solani]|uniref:AMP-binding protein n=2 Tax=Dickeya solani TaxID=1089444 RepID=UPI0003AA7F77|nr:AMP-binding protein [Dickeya solani]ANE75581.1 alanine-phosphoribitol ligase [Dickeya solani IPO 2222]AUC43032.1 D-alanine--poly(phosphoribitol) ligase subunit 1 [Dickeya solani RNS 08.23.3.1.A]AUH09005.1 alanine-phosphoribitol ligase [Dickeya solani D s0432-1]AUH12985.1 alanine-phosphoribitol ligase [Dickeya solani]AYQ45983.1 D-alanine--poly(phosphoribitol) ligase subunit 1 [Dickeya solani]